MLAYVQEPIALVLQGLALASAIEQIGLTAAPNEEMEKISNPEALYMRASDHLDLGILKDL